MLNLRNGVALLHECDEADLIYGVDDKPAVREQADESEDGDHSIEDLNVIFDTHPRQHTVAQRVECDLNAREHNTPAQIVDSEQNAE